jgi:integrase
MSGHLRQRSPGSWELRYRVDGKVKTATFRGSKRDAGARLRELMTAADRGQHVDKSKVTVGAWVAERLETWDVCERSREGYRNLAKLVSAHLGAIGLQQLRTLDCERWHRELRAKGLAPSTISAAHRLLRHALDDAERHSVVARNVARLQPPPAAPARKVAVPTENTIGPMLTALRGTEFYAPVVVTLYTGLRRGELLALRWSDVDLDGMLMRVERSLDEIDGVVSFKSPKTASGARAISLPAAAVEALREHRRQQLEMRLALGLGRPPDDALVFPTRDGAPQSPNLFSVAWHRAVRRLGLPRVSWHGLRHMHASLLLRHGVDLATASKRLGHSRVDITARVYVHAIAENDRHAADALDKALGQRC